MKYLFYLLFIIIIFSCDSSNESIVNSNRTEAIEDEIDLSSTFEGVSFFDFDEIHYYSIDIDAKQVYDLSEKDSLSENNKLFVNIILHELGEDTSFVDKLEELNFTPKVIENSKLELINDLFRYKSVDEFSTTTCDPFYRDILIFKKNLGISGIAKICFECDKHSILGAKVPNASFGQSGEFQELAKLIK